MGQSYIDSSGMEYININNCRTFNLSLTPSLTPLQSVVCAEVIIINKTGQSINLYDSGFVAASAAMLLDDDESIVIRGITNSIQVSAQTVSGSGTLYYRTQSYSNTPSR